MMSRLVRRAPYLASTYFDLGRFFAPPESREPLFATSGASGFSASPPFQSINHRTRPDADFQ
jgi:hypothetical protein